MEVLEGKVPAPSGLRETPPDMLHRVVSRADHAEFVLDILMDLLRAPSPESVTNTNGIYEMQPTDGASLLCHVSRWCWMGDRGKRSALLMECQPLPASRYLRLPLGIPWADNETRATKRKKLKKEPAGKEGGAQEGQKREEWLDENRLAIELPDEFLDKLLDDPVWATDLMLDL